MIIKTFSVSGFGGGYETTCQKMIWNGVRFISQNGYAPKYKEYENIYGVAIAENDDAEKLDKAVMEGIDDATGAMHQCAVGHIRYIHKNGYKKWFKELTKDRKEGSFEYKYEHDFTIPQ